MKSYMCLTNGCCIYSPPSIRRHSGKYLCCLDQRIVRVHVSRFPRGLPSGGGVLIQVYLHSGFQRDSYMGLLTSDFLIVSWAFLGPLAISGITLSNYSLAPFAIGIEGITMRAIGPLELARAWPPRAREGMAS